MKKLFALALAVLAVIPSALAQVPVEIETGNATAKRLWSSYSGGTDTIAAAGTNTVGVLNLTKWVSYGLEFQGKLNATGTNTVTIYWDGQVVSPSVESNWTSNVRSLAITVPAAASGTNLVVSYTNRISNLWPYERIRIGNPGLLVTNVSIRIIGQPISYGLTR